MANQSTMDLHTWAPGRYIGQEEADHVQLAVQAALKAIHLQLTGYGVLTRPTFAASSTPDLEVHIGAGRAITPTGHLCQWTTTQDVDISTVSHGTTLGPSAVTGVNKQRYIVVGVQEVFQDSEQAFIYHPGYSDDGDPYYYKHTASCELVPYMSAEVTLGQNWETSATLLALLAQMRADDVEPLLLAIRVSGDTSVDDTDLFDCSRWLFEETDPRAEHQDLRRHGGYGHFPIVATTDGKVTYTKSGGTVTFPGGERIWIGWLSDRHGLLQRAVTMPASSIALPNPSEEYIIRMYLDDESGEPVVYYATRTNGYPEDTAIGLHSHGLSGATNGAFPATLIDIPLVQCVTNAGGVVGSDFAIANTASSWLQADGDVAGMVQRSDGIGYPVTVLHRAVLPFHPTRSPSSAVVQWNGGRLWTTEGLESFGIGGGAILNNWYALKAKADGTAAPQNHNMDLSGLPDDDELPIAGFLGNAGVFCYRDMGFWGHTPHIEGFDLHVSGATPGILTLHPGHYFKQGRVVPGPQKYSITLTDAGLTNYRDTNFSLVNSTWYYLYLVPLAYYRLHGQGAAPTDGGLTAYPFLSTSAPDYSGGHPTWPWAQFVAALRCETAATGVWMAILKRGDFVVCDKQVVSAIIPPNYLTDPPLFVDLSASVPQTAQEANFSIYMACSGAYAWAIGPKPGADPADEYPYSWLFGVASVAYLGPARVPLYDGNATSGVYAIGNATIANLTSMSWSIHGYYESPLRPYHYTP